MPASAPKAPNRMIPARSPLAIRCAAAQSTTDHWKGCRVTRKMPRTVLPPSVSAGAPTAVGFCVLSPATASTKANGSTTSGTAVVAAGVGQSST
jgi:hypothetical protein